MGDGEQRRLLAHLGFYLSGQYFFCLDALTDIPDGAQQARAAPIMDQGPAYFDVKRRAIPADVDDECFEYAARLGLPYMLPEQGMVFRKHEGRWMQPYEFLAGVAVHLAGGGVGFDHIVQPNVIDHQPIAGGFEDISILLFRSDLLIRDLTHKADLLFLAALSFLHS